MKLFPTLFSLFGFVAICPSANAQTSASIQLEQIDEGVRVLVDGELFTQYLTAAPSPILWPLLAVDGTKMTRSFPMSDEDSDEKRDHPHHRSLWFTHGEVNGIDFWHRGGTVVHQEFTELTSGKEPVIASTNLWVKTGDQAKVLTERRRLTFGATDSFRWIDFDIVLVADFGDVHFGDTKEGSFAVRVAESMKVDRGKGGAIVNSEGQKNILAWGKPAKWVNYTGPIGDKTYGIAMFCHPQSFSFPHRWHVRTYGLFAANPFGSNSFANNNEKGEGVLLKQSEELRLRYRVVLHLGITEPAEMDKLYEEFVQ